MTQEHPITPPPELVQEWLQQGRNCISEMDGWKDFATQAARWGADQELEACRLWVSENCDIYSAVELIQFRRPKPPSLKEQALTQVESFACSMETLGMDSDLIRRALESLPD